MTPDIFLAELERIFGRSLKAEQLPVYREKLRRFHGDQLLEIFNSLIEECRTFPKISDIFRAAQSFGFLQSESVNVKTHQWTDTDCKLCGGEGRLSVIWLLTFEIQNERPRETHALKRIIPYSQSGSSQLIIDKNEFSSLFRCSCLAGDAPNIPKSWPKWSRSILPVRYP